MKKSIIIDDYLIFFCMGRCWLMIVTADPVSTLARWCFWFTWTLMWIGEGGFDEGIYIGDGFCSSFAIFRNACVVRPASGSNFICRLIGILSASLIPFSIHDSIIFCDIVVSYSPLSLITSSWYDVIVSSGFCFRSFNCSNIRHDGSDCVNLSSIADFNVSHWVKKRLLSYQRFASPSSFAVHIQCKTASFALIMRPIRTILVKNCWTFFSSLPSNFSRFDRHSR